MGKPEKPLVYRITLSGCHEITSHKAESHGYVSIKRNGKRHRAHRYIYEQSHHVSLTPEILVLHRCDNRLCINPEHLFLGKPIDNSRDMVRKGRSAYGEHHGLAKLNTQQVNEIIESGKSQISRADTARKYHVSRTDIYLIQTRQIWEQLCKEVE